MGLFDVAAQKLADLEARVAALEGATEPIVYEPSDGLFLWSGDVIDGKSFTGIDYAVNAASGAYNTAVTGATVSRCYFESCRFGIKAGSGPVCSGLTFDRLVARDCRMPIFVADVVDSTFTDLDLEGRPGETRDHCMYLERGLKRLTFRNLTLTKGGGYCLHMYNVSGVRGEDLLFEDCVLDATGGWLPLVIMGFQRVTLRRVTLITDATDGPCVMLGDCADCVIEDFDARGGYSLVYSHGGCSNITFRNGTYLAGSPLILGTTAGITFENVVRV